jgi:hypothetical protein
MKEEERLDRGQGCFVFTEASRGRFLNRFERWLGPFPSPRMPKAAFASARKKPRLLIPLSALVNLLMPPSTLVRRIKRGLRSCFFLLVVIYDIYIFGCWNGSNFFLFSFVYIRLSWLDSRVHSD